LVRDPEMQSPEDEPVSLIVADYEFDASEEDVALLSELGELAADLYAPVVTAAANKFFGATTLEELGKKGSLGRALDDEAHAAWRAFRKSDASRWVALAVNRFVLEAGPSGEARYGNPALVVAAVAAARFADVKWCAPLAGPKHGLCVKLAVRTTQMGAREGTM